MDKQCSFTQKSLLVIYTHHFFFECLTDIISVNKLLCGHVYADKLHNYEHTCLEKKSLFIWQQHFPPFFTKMQQLLSMLTVPKLQELLTLPTLHITHPTLLQPNIPLCCSVSNAPAANLLLRTLYTRTVSEDIL